MNQMRQPDRKWLTTLSWASVYCLLLRCSSFEIAGLAEMIRGGPYCGGAGGVYNQDLISLDEDDLKLTWRQTSTGIAMLTSVGSSERQHRPGS